MRKALAGFVIIGFTGLLSTSILAYFTTASMDATYTHHQIQHPFFLGY